MNTTVLERTDLPGWHQARTRKGRMHHVWCVNKIAARLIRQNGGRIMPYRNLPIEARHAIAYYMAIDGEAWDCPKRLDDSWTPRGQLMTRFKRAHRFFVNRYGDQRFGYVELPTRQLVEAAWEYRQQFPIDHRFTTLDDYHRWYLSERDAPSYGKSVWPVILNGSQDDDGAGLLQDGWHRFHGYVAHGVEMIPCVWYAQVRTSAVA